MVEGISKIMGDSLLSEGPITKVQFGKCPLPAKILQLLLMGIRETPNWP